MEENQRQRQLSISADDPELAQFLEDERVAIFLQNEEFVRELRRNKDFMSTLELDTSDGNGASLGPSGGSTHTDSDAAFKETLKHMGKVSRRKFAQLARLFSRRKRRSFQQLLSEGSTPSRDNLLIREDQYHEFQNEGSDNEDIHRENPLILGINETEDNSNHSNISNNTNNTSINSNSFRTNHKI